MFQRIVAAGAALVLALSCLDAAAAARASTRLSDLRIQLYALGKTAPTVSFTVAGGSTADALTTSAMPGLSSDGHADGGAAFAAVRSASPDNAALGSFAQIAGDPFGAGASMTAAAFASASRSQAEGAASLLDGNSYARFTLSADTVMVVTAMADLDVQADAAWPDDYAVGSVDLELAGSQGDSAQSSAAHSLAYAGGFSGARDTRHIALSIAFTNAFDVAIDGSFFAGVDATAVSTVPEPAASAMEFAGLALLAALMAAGRRRPRVRRA